MRCFNRFLMLICLSVINFGCSTYGPKYGSYANDVAVAQSTFHANTIDSCREISNKFTSSLEPNMQITEVKRIASEIDKERYETPNVEKSEINEGQKIVIIEYWCYQVADVLTFKDGKLLKTDQYPLKTLYGYVDL